MVVSDFHSAMTSENAKLGAYPQKIPEKGF